MGSRVEELKDLDSGFGGSALGTIRGSGLGSRLRGHPRGQAYH